ncbi:hypothetical protein B0H14DRAFT_3596149 [Mycena olivaceomarginata]|nr:hypothetical protein B0H14DRAFT_3596149 [Mycena olivaceomarginata]
MMGTFADLSTTQDTRLAHLAELRDEDSKKRKGEDARRAAPVSALETRLDARQRTFAAYLRPGVPPVRRTMRQCLILGHCFSAASATVFVAITFPLWQPSSQHAQSLARWQSDSAEKRVRTTLSIAPMRARKHSPWPRDALHGSSGSTLSRQDGRLVRARNQDGIGYRKRG